MTLYSLVLFVHVTALLVLFAALGIEALSLFRLRRAATLADVRLWLDPVPKLPAIAMTSLLIIILSGVYLTVRISAFRAAWPKVTMVAILLMGPAASVGAKRLRAIRRLSAAGAIIDSNLRGLLRDPILKISLALRIAVVLAIVLLMGAKPGIQQSIAIVGVALVVGVLLGQRGRDHRPLSTETARAGSTSQ